MRILTRYILREVTAHALIGVAIFTFVLFTRDLGRILELVVRASASARWQHYSSKRDNNGFKPTSGLPTNRSESQQPQIRFSKTRK
jgi:hypothetical protein